MHRGEDSGQRTWPSSAAKAGRARSRGGGAPVAWALCLTAGVMQEAAGAGACVVAKRLGNSTAIEWAGRPGVTVEALIDELQQRLRQRGYGRDRYEDLFPQANTALEHGFLVVVETQYPNARGRQRTSYGCGYSGESFARAERNALRDLSTYSWGWTPETGFRVLGQSRY